MQVKSSELVPLFVELGLNSATTWDKEKMEGRLSKIEALANDSDTKLSEGHEELLTAILKAQKAGDPIDIEMDSKPAKPANNKKPAGKKKPAAKPVEDPEDDEPDRGPDHDPDEESASKPTGKKGKGKGKSKGKGKGKKKPANRAGVKGVGIIKSIIETLSTASKSKPMMRETIWKKLCSKYEDRDPSGMRVTVYSQVPLRLKKVKGLDVRGSDSEGGYYIVGKKST